jgi:hypothetical protein
MTMRPKPRLAAITVLAAVPIVAAAASLIRPAAGAPMENPAPDVVPSIREWTGGSGRFELRPPSRIVVDSSDLVGEAQLLRHDMAAVTGLELPVATGKNPHPGDLFLSDRGAPAQVGSEGYVLDIGNRVELRGGSGAGVFYGTQTVLQMLRSTAGHRTLPRGEARDWPRFRERGYLLDAGRKYWSPDYIVETIREMAYLKLNTLQLHLSDDNAFRLVSDRFPYLAAPQAYTRADIARFEAAAREYHVTIIPEIEMPAHAGAILKARPDFGINCLNFGTTLDVTRPEVREFTAALIREFAPLFSGPEFHIATDEYPMQVNQERCPTLVDYAQANGLGSTADIFVNFINEMNSVARSLGKRTVIWNWWDVNQNPTVAPDKTIKVEVWTTPATGGGGEFGPQHYLDLGYDVVASPSDTLYVTPGTRLLPDPKFLYEEWAPQEDPHLWGYQISVWADNAITETDSAFDDYLRRPREAMADRVWGGPRRGTVADLFERADAIGTPPGVPEYTLPGTLTGTPYGTSPAWGNLPNTFDKAWDGDLATFFDYAEPSGGYTGIDLGAGHAASVVAVRFAPRVGQLGRMVGGRFEGCSGGPTSGCRTLATVQDRPVLGWNELAVAEGGAYRWLRYVAPDNSFDDVADIQFVGASNDVTVEGPAQLRQLDENRVVTSYRNNGTSPVFDVRLDLSAYAVGDRGARAVQPSGKQSFPVVQPGDTVSTAWHVDVPLSAATGAYHLVGRASYQRRPGPTQPIEYAGGFSNTTLGPALTAVLDPGFVGLGAGDSKNISLRITNNAAGAVTIAWNYTRSPAANAAFTLAPATGTLTIPAGGTASATLTASAAQNAAGAGPGPARVDLTAGETRIGSVELNVIWYPGAAPSLAATYDNKGITDDDNPLAGTFDGGEASYSAQGLAAAGLAPGATVNHDGQTFTWPDVPTATPDNTKTNGQVIAASGSGAKLGFLGSAAFGTQSGTVFVTYTDGSIAQAPLAFADWYFNDPAPGTDIVATVPWNVPPEHPDQDHPVSVFYGSIPLDPSKTVQYVTLPTNPNLHIFAMAVGGA